MRRIRSLLACGVMAVVMLGLALGQGSGPASLAITEVTETGDGGLIYHYPVRNGAGATFRLRTPTISVFGTNPTDRKVILVADGDNKNVTAKAAGTFKANEAWEVSLPAMQPGARELIAHLVELLDEIIPAVVATPPPARLSADKKTALQKVEEAAGLAVKAKATAEQANLEAKRLNVLARKSTDVAEDAKSDAKMVNDAAKNAVNAANLATTEAGKAANEAAKAAAEAKTAEDEAKLVTAPPADKTKADDESKKAKLAKGEAENEKTAALNSAQEARDFAKRAAAAREKKGPYLGAKTNTVNAIVPVAAGGGVPQPSVVGFSNAPDVPPTTNHNDSTTEISVYDGVLRLRVGSLEKTAPEFALFRQRKDSVKDYILIPDGVQQTSRVLSGDEQIVDLRVKLGPNEVGQLFVIKPTGVSHIHSLPVNLKGVRSDPIARITLKSVGDTGSATARLLRTRTPVVAIETGENVDIPDTNLIISLGGRPITPQQPPTRPAGQNGWRATIDVPPDLDSELTVALVRGLQRSPESDPVTISVRRTGPRVVSVSPQNLAQQPGPSKIVTVRFNRENPINSATVAGATNIKVFRLDDAGKNETEVTTPAAQVNSLNVEENSVSISLSDLKPGLFRLRLKEGIQDLYGNKLNATGPTDVKGRDETADLLYPVGADLPLTVPGVSDATGPYVKFPEFTNPRPSSNGFNPSDHVETRVVRLYYYRDAHRVAQIVNRDARSYNRVAVAVRRRMAEQERDKAEQLTQKRQAQERVAVEEARNAREAEKAFAQAQQELSEVNTQLAQQRLEIQQLTPFTDPDRSATLTAEQRTAVSDRLARANDNEPRLATRSLAVQTRVASLDAAMRTARGREVQATEQFRVTAAQEDSAGALSFRLAVAAAHEDPDTYAPGQPDSIDPVQQVSVSVIGDAVIQLRGPIKGINIIRRMINQIDQPAGQVRVAIHTVQINGERGDRMERVATRIQTYIDHSRFLTMQSGLMLRKAVVKVASLKAEEAAMFFPGSDQAARDQKYLHAFFGKDFIDELRALDSEFLRTGNKLLSLHSMDTTSLASAMFLLALAKNSVRFEILQEFQRQMVEELPQAEMNYFAAGGDRREYMGKKVELYACNARFQSFLGLFNAELQGTDTIAPLQREFTRLAQIFKSQLIAELELNQRVMERALIEQRLNKYEEDIQDQIDAEKRTKAALQQAQNALWTARADVGPKLGVILAEVTRVTQQLSELEIARSETVRKVQAYKLAKSTPTGFSTWLLRRLWALPPERSSGTSDVETSRHALTTHVTDWIERINKFKQTIKGIKLESPHDRDFEELKTKWEEVQNLITNDGPQPEIDAALEKIRTLSQPILEHVTQTARKIQEDAQNLSLQLNSLEVNVERMHQNWVRLLLTINRYVQGDLLERNRNNLQEASAAFQGLIQANIAVQQSIQAAAKARRPLDQKKLLDMLIDEQEDKYIELLEGTRAHTANIDSYLKRLATALDDDLNTQFYYPAFRQVRAASWLYDVSLGQVETTSILTNNRMFAKVEPQATMEFDLPRRDIVITEAMRGAKGLIDQYGALAQDPTFLALVKMRSGQPTSSMIQGGADGMSFTRSVLPGLSRDADERLLAQGGPLDRQLASPLEALVPDPAVYKFETGTGYEISPVIQPDGQSVVFKFNYMYTTNVREPVRADEKHLGRVKRHFIDTNVQLGNYELREISKYSVALKAARTSRGVPGLEDVPGVGLLFRPLPSAESSLQQNLILGQATIFPTLFDLMGLRWAPAVADLDPLALSNAEFVVRGRRRDLMNRVFDFSSSKVDEFMRIGPAERRTDLYRTQETIPSVHPDGYRGPGLNLRDSHLREGYDPRQVYPETRYIPRNGLDGALPPGTGIPLPPGGVPLLPGLPVQPGFTLPAPRYVVPPEPELPVPPKLLPGASLPSRSPYPGPSTSYPAAGGWVPPPAGTAPTLPRLAERPSLPTLPARVPVYSPAPGAVAPGTPPRDLPSPRPVSITPLPSSVPLPGPPTGFPAAGVGTVPMLPPIEDRPYLPSLPAPVAAPALSYPPR